MRACWAYRFYRQERVNAGQWQTTETWLPHLLGSETVTILAVGRRPAYALLRLEAWVQTPLPEPIGIVDWLRNGVVRYWCGCYRDRLLIEAASPRPVRTRDRVRVVSMMQAMRRHMVEAHPDWLTARSDG